jgi:hypothetical protein
MKILAKKNTVGAPNLFADGVHIVPYSTVSDLYKARIGKRQGRVWYGMVDMVDINSFILAQLKADLKPDLKYLSL